MTENSDISSPYRIIFPTNELYDVGAFDPSLLPTENNIFNLVLQNEVPNSQNNLKFPNHLAYNEQEVRGNITKSLEEARIIEEMARSSSKWLDLKNHPNIKLVVDFSAPGTYSNGVKDDRYKDKPWARGMDRVRADEVARIAIILSGIKSGDDYSKFGVDAPLLGNSELEDHERTNIAHSFEKSGIHIAYLGTQEEAIAVDKVVHTPSSLIPPGSLLILKEGITDTITQVTELKRFLHEQFTTGLLKPGDEVLFPLGPQGIRVMRNLKHYDAIPEGVNVSLFPIGTPPSGFPDYPLGEIKGAIFYALAGLSSFDPCSYQIVGHQSSV